MCVSPLNGVMGTVTDYDALVVGGGPAGAAAALMLTKLGWSVCLVDVGGQSIKIGESLPPAATPFLRDLGLWDSFLDEGHLPCYGNVSAWGSDELAQTDFIFDPNGIGWHLDRTRFDAFLRNAARDAGTEVIAPGRVQSWEWLPDRATWLVSVQYQAERDSVRVRWLIDATGRGALVARRNGARSNRSDKLVSFYAFLSSSDFRRAGDRDSRTLIEATPEGWWYSAPLPGGDHVVSFHTDSDIGVHLSLLNRERFLSALGATRHLAPWLPLSAYRLHNGPFRTSAATRWLSTFLGQAWLAVGDASLTFDPLSSQGILHALYSGTNAARTLDSHYRGDSGAVHAYHKMLEKVFSIYLHNRAAYYAMETRWQDQVFWQRRSVLREFRHVGSMHRAVT
jgi:flavin-dependent dehydrogenase